MSKTYIVSINNREVCDEEARKRLDEHDTQFENIANEIKEIGSPTDEQVINVINKAISDGLITGSGAKTSVTNNDTFAVGASSDSGGDSEEGGDTTVTTYNIVNTLTNCVNSNTTTSIEENSSYVATISANEGYTLGDITVTMGGTDISSTVVSGSSINISSVTGNIVITCTATEQASSITLQSTYNGISLNSTEDFDIKNAKTIILTNNGDTVINYINVNFDTESYGRISRTLGDGNSLLALGNGDSYTITVSEISSISLATGQGCINITGSEIPFTIVVSY